MAQAAKLNREEDRASSQRIFPDGAGGESFASIRSGCGSFLHDVRVEMKQVNWPSRLDVWSTTIVVIVTVAFFACSFFLRIRF